MKKQRKKWKHRKENSMPCIFDIKPEERHCRYCGAFCDERQPNPIETHATNKIE